ncbi:PAS domain-containing protein [Streptomyces fagopyri]|uniref:PAS domain-containing protein n=1 Tax=Streptomyces fagopyri TaxID=2662397 RepID=UPI0033C2F4AA
MEVVLQLAPVAWDATGGWAVLAVGPARLPWRGAQRSLLEGLPTRSSIGTAVLDTRLRCLWSNEAPACAAGIPSEQHLGRVLDVVFLPKAARSREEEIRRVRATGTPLID